MLIRIPKHLSAALIMTVSTTLYADINLQEGLWEITNKIEISGLPIKIPDQKITQCITKQNSIPTTNKEVAKYCQISDQKIEGDTITWTMQCSHNMQSSGSITYHGDTFDGRITIHTEIPQMGSVKMTNQASGRRIGECQ